MYKVVKQSRAVQCVIVLLSLLVMATIYPLRLWEETIPSVSNQRLAGSTDGVMGDDYLLQRFIAQYDHLGTINLYVADFQNGWDFDQEVNYFLFRMLDSDMQIMFEQQVDVRFIDIPGFCPIYINEDLEVAKDYYFFLQGVKGSRVWFGLEETEHAGTPYVSRLVYNYDELEGYNIVGEYHYTVPLRKDKVFKYDAALALLMVLAVAAVELYVRLTKKDRLVTVGQAVRATANCLVAAGVLTAFWFVSVRRLFSGEWVDNIFYTAGILIAGVTLFYLVNRKRDRGHYMPLPEKWKKNGADYLQTVFFAGAVWACCNYMNGLYDIHHRAAERQLIVFFALAALVMGKKEDIRNKFTLIYGVIAAAVTYRYCSIYVDVLAMDPYDMKILRWHIAAAVLSGLLLVSILVQLVRRRKMARISLWYGAVVGVFFVLLVVFRNTRWWTVTLVIGFTLFYIRYGLWDKKEHLLQNICNGLLLNFVCCMLFCFARRPFLAWVYARYPFIFHTVTVTAVYMALVIGAVLMRLTDRYAAYRKAEEKNMLRYFGTDLLLLGMAGTYLLFTASRTGFLAVALMLLLVFIFTAVGAGKQRIKKVAVLALSMALAVAWCFPMIFTAQRILPAVCSNVYRHEVEAFPDVITRGAEWDSMYFITVKRFAEVFNNKIFNIPESGTYSYERSPEYQKYLAKRFNSKGEVVWEGSIDEMYEEDAAGTGTSPGNVPETAGGETNSGGMADGRVPSGNGAGDGADSGKTAGNGAQKLEIIGTKTEEERAADDLAAAELEKEALGGGSAKAEEPEPEEEEPDVSVYEKTEEYANGRMDIFRAYLKELNLTGHDDMNVILPDGALAVHAHNIYLQVAYDHGLIVGVVFILVGAATFVQGCIYYGRRRNRVPCAAMPAVILVGVAMAGLVEWIFHLCNPAGFILMLMLAPLLFDMGEKDGERDAR